MRVLATGRAREWLAVLGVLVTFAFDHDGAGVNRWDVQLDGAEASPIDPDPVLDPDAPNTGIYFFTFQRELTAGRHTLAVRACFVAATADCSAWSNTLTVECTDTTCRGVDVAPGFRPPGKPVLLPGD